jgi:hypothetical protein
MRTKANPPSFLPVPLRARNDGWTPQRQTGFIEALAQSGCVDEACKRVGMSRSSAYALRSRKSAESFRAAWDAALDHAIQRLSDAAFSRAINGVSRPVYFQGEQVGEKVYFDERLTMFLLRYRDPMRYGRWRDRTRVDVEPDGVARYLWHLIDRVDEDGWADTNGLPRSRQPPLEPPQVVGESGLEAERRRAKGR